MITYTHGDMFAAPVQTFVIPTNCVGVMGAGVALAAKKRWPDISASYMTMCKNGLIKPGRLAVYTDDVTGRVLVMFPTKTHYSKPSRIEFIKSGLETLALNYVQMGITGLSMPAIGCGLGGLDWAEVKMWIDVHLKLLPIPIYVYERRKREAA